MILHATLEDALRHLILGARLPRKSSVGLRMDPEGDDPLRIDVRHNGQIVGGIRPTRDGFTSWIGTEEPS